MKPFLLADALAGKPVVTRNGKKVLGVANLNATDFPVVAYLEGDGRPQSFTTAGMYTDNYASGYDLFMAPVEVTKWANIFPGVLTYLFDSEEAADAQVRLTGDTRIGKKAHKITYEE